MSEPGYDCLRDALTLARSEQPPRTVKVLRERLAEAGHSAEAISEALASWAGSVVTRLTKDE